MGEALNVTYTNIDGTIMLVHKVGVCATSHLRFIFRTSLRNSRGT
jgi:hypothetical protein